MSRSLTLFALAVLTKITTSTDVQLAPNQFFQANRILEQLYGTGVSVYNARISVQVTAGSGRVASYDSVIDNFSADPTYVQAQ